MRYFNIIITNHALERIKERGLSKELAWETFNQADTNYKTDQGSHAFMKKYDGYKTTLICKKNEKGEWIVLSFWRDPPLAGTRDYKNHENWKKFKKAGFWGKVWYSVKQQLGL